MGYGEGTMMGLYMNRSELRWKGGDVSSLISKVHLSHATLYETALSR